MIVIPLLVYLSSKVWRKKRKTFQWIELVGGGAVHVFNHLWLVSDEETHVAIFNFCWSWPDDLPGHFAAEKSRVRILNNPGICTVNILRKFAEPKFREWFISCKRRLFPFRSSQKLTRHFMTFCSEIQEIVRLPNLRFLIKHISLKLCDT